jgi:hypothetical protein
MVKSQIGSLTNLDSIELINRAKEVALNFAHMNKHRVKNYNYCEMFLHCGKIDKHGLQCNHVYENKRQSNERRSRDHNFLNSGKNHSNDASNYEHVLNRSPSSTPIVQNSSENLQQMRSPKKQSSPFRVYTDEEKRAYREKKDRETQLKQFQNVNNVSQQATFDATKVIQTKPFTSTTPKSILKKND